MEKTLLILLFFLSACCKEGNETSKYFLTDFEKEIVPYAEGDVIAFKHSNGFEFNLKTTNRATELRRTPTEHCGEDYSSYETLLTELTSSTPELFINFKVLPVHYVPTMTIKINKYYFDIDLGSEPGYDSLTVDGKQYREVYQSESINSDTTIIRPQEILYNKESGIIQISMTNNESYTINQ